VAREAGRGQIPITPADIEKIPEILEAPDKIEISGKTRQGLDGILYVKRFNGTVYYVQEVRTGRRQLATVTMWKKN
jgi:hypothetical protein